MRRQCVVILLGSPNETADIRGTIKVSFENAVVRLLSVANVYQFKKNLLLHAAEKLQQVSYAHLTTPKSVVTLHCNTLFF